jgi:hypothetical protein
LTEPILKLNEEMRSRNPFLDPLVTELIEDPQRYRRMFSERILVGETLQVFQPTNIVLLGPQGAGKSMILNLLRYRVLDRWIDVEGGLPSPLQHVSPFLGISVNLVRIALHAFGRRSVSLAMSESINPALDALCAADYLSTLLFREFLYAIDYLRLPEATSLANWLGISRSELTNHSAAISSWPCLYGYYEGRHSVQQLISRCDERLLHWSSFLNMNCEVVDPDIWTTKTTIESTLHQMGAFLKLVSPDKQPPLFVSIDQYEVIPEMEGTHSMYLHRIINTLFKTRDPLFFCKLGARSYDWGKELRILGSDSRIEVQRDYSIIDLSDVLMRSEDGGSVFPSLALDVITKRLKSNEPYSEQVRDIDPRSLFGDSNRDEDGWIYFDKRLVDKMIQRVVKDLKGSMREELVKTLGHNSTPLTARLNEAWVIQQERRGVRAEELLRDIRSHAPEANTPQMSSWRKERINVALLQIASRANAAKRYYGWVNIVQLSGGNISAFLLLCAEIWDQAAKMGVLPTPGTSLSTQIQSEGVMVASRKWLERDRSEQLGGERRYRIIHGIGTAIRLALVDNNPGLSNPGHSGFSIDNEELSDDSDLAIEVNAFLRKGVNWAIFEERVHTSKNDKRPRRKYYLHPLLSPILRIPHTRVKEPKYVRVETVSSWIRLEAVINFDMRTNRAEHNGNPSNGLFDTEDL